MKDPEIRQKGDPVGAALDKVRQTRAKPWDIVIDPLAALEIPFPSDKIDQIMLSQIYSEDRLLFSHYKTFRYLYSNLARCSKIIGALRPSAWLECLHRALKDWGF